VLPYYQEFHAQIIDLVQVLNNNNMQWLDTGCGTGTLAEKIIKNFENISLTLCDPSEKMLAIAKQKLSKYNTLKFINKSTQDMQFENEFDVITAVQAHHYLTMENRMKATQRCYQALKKNGIYITFENIKLSSDISDTIAQKRYENFLKSNGKTQDEIIAYLARRNREFFPITIEQHIKLLKNCGFKTVDILWTSYLQAGFFAVK
ncbi:MAG: class I SAM-dependent methyltransferase, partial [Oscillospiraceae bacterium]|nr:class I SAM-dependent methyltransferase [Oscillospiraceae bacterium]